MSELTVVGDVFGMGSRQAAKLAKRCSRYMRAQSLVWHLVRHARRMASIGA